MLPAFIRHNGNLAFFALLAVAASGFGQTFFISIFGSALRAEFSLSHAHYGMIYSGATLASALALMPMIAGLLLLSLRGDGWVPYAYLTLLGITQAGTGTAGGALALRQPPPGSYPLRLPGGDGIGDGGVTAGGGRTAGSGN